MAFFKCRIDDEVYELSKLTIGLARRLKLEFGLTELEALNPTDPEQLAGILTVIVEQKHPEWDTATCAKFVDELDIETFAPDEDEADPTLPVEAVAPTPEPDSPSSETTPEISGPLA
jgi:hypothetical protein